MNGVSAYTHAPITSPSQYTCPDSRFIVCKNSVTRVSAMPGKVSVDGMKSHIAARMSAIISRRMRRLGGSR